MINMGYCQACTKTCLQLHLMRECSCYTVRHPFDGNITAYDSIDTDGLLPCNDQSLPESKRSGLKTIAQTLLF